MHYDIANYFPDLVMHLGYDEINMDCWGMDASIQVRRFRARGAWLREQRTLHAPAYPQRPRLPPPPHLLLSSV